MAALNDLINQVQDKALRERLMAEAARLTKQKKFGLVFEEHIPECTPLYGIEIKCGSTVAKKTGAINDMYRVTKINGGDAVCLHLASGESETIALSDLVPVAKFGEPIYPTLQPIDKVKNAPDSDLWHTLIEADNYHALQLLEYLYPQKVDCIYIDIIVQKLIQFNYFKKCYV
jgi:adenine-specific DNA-methyltransferase